MLKLSFLKIQIGQEIVRVPQLNALRLNLRAQTLLCGELSEGGRDFTEGIGEEG